LQPTEDELAAATVDLFAQISAPERRRCVDVIGQAR
jgi:hypothetical protein